jgi:hypothetical protein
MLGLSLVRTLVIQKRVPQGMTRARMFNEYETHNRGRPARARSRPGLCIFATCKEGSIAHSPKERPASSSPLSSSIQPAAQRPAFSAPELGEGE